MSVIVRGDGEHHLSFVVIVARRIRGVVQMQLKELAAWLQVWLVLLMLLLLVQ